MTWPFSARQLAGSNLPDLGRGGDQHGFGRGPGLAQAFPFRPGAGAAAGGLHAENSVVVNRINGSGGDPDLAPIRVKFFGHEHGQRRIDALAHFGMVDDDGDGIVRADAEEGVGGKDRVKLWLIRMVPG